MSELYPVNVDPKEHQVERLVKFFRGAYGRILEEINTASSFGVTNRRAILSQIDGILAQLGVDVQDYVDKTLPQYYRQGADEAVKQLKNIDAEIQVSTGFNRLHKDAIIALIDSTMQSYYESITGIKRSATTLLGRATREMLTNEIAQGVLSGEALRKVRQNIKGILAEDGLSAITDRAGRKWKLDTYAEVVYRTKVVEARNMGLANRMVENNYDLVQVSDHAGECPQCRPWEGKVLSVTGKTAGYPTLAKAQADGLFHPNCRHAINTLVPSLAQKTIAYDPDKGALIREPGESLRRK